jgi:hypothetical protein
VSKVTVEVKADYYSGINLATLIIHGGDTHNIMVASNPSSNSGGWLAELILFHAINRIVELEAENERLRKKYIETQDWEYRLYQRVDAIGNDPTQSQIERLLEWIFDNVPTDCLYVAAGEVLFIPKLYTELTDRIREMGI